MARLSRWPFCPVGRPLISIRSDSPIAMKNHRIFLLPAAILLLGVAAPAEVSLAVQAVSSATFSGLARACAGGVNDETHKIRLVMTVTRGGAVLANTTIRLAFMPQGHCSNANEKPEIRPRFIRRKSLVRQISMRTNRKGQAAV